MKLPSLIGRNAQIGRSAALADLKVAVRLTRRLPGYLRRPSAPGLSHVIIGERLEHRSANLLSMVRELIYQQPASPYLRLLRHAGCELGDFERLVQREGVEGALLGLAERGVYLQADEFKGRREVVRGSLRFKLDQAQLHNPRLQSDLEAASSGSRGSRTIVPIDLIAIRDQGVDTVGALVARGGVRWAHGIWGVPGGAAFDMILSPSAFGIRPERWFSQVDPTAAGLHPRYRWSSRWLTLVSTVAGRHLPPPRFVPLEQPAPILAWIAAEQRCGRTPCLRTYPSSAVRLCKAAQASGQSLEGMQFWLGGEPVTAARLAALRATGARVFSVYGVIEFGPLATGCDAPAEPDDLHLFSDRLALIQPGGMSLAGDVPADALLATTLLRSARVVALNAATGDQAVLTSRRCGCSLEAVGWDRHIQMIRSYQKVTAAGMTFLDADIVRLLDQTLPTRFGGTAGDYQLVEDEDEDGQAQLTLVIDASVGPLDPASVRRVFLAELAHGSGVERLMGLAWDSVGLPRIERRAPRAALTGKVQHLHQARRPARVAE